MMPAGRAIIVPNDEKAYVLSSDAVKLVPKKSINTKYLLYGINSNTFRNQITAETQGITRARTSIGKLKTYAFPLPPMPEQQRIVDRIERLFVKLDQAKELAQNALDSFETRKAAILYKAFTGELTAKWREEQGLRMDSWQTKKLRDCGKWYGGGTPSKSVSSYWENGTIMWVTPKDMKEKYIIDTIDHITDVAVVESSTQLIKQPSLLFVMRSGILRRILPISIAKDKITVNQDLKALIPEGIELEYLYWFCISHESDIRENCSKSGTTVESIETTALYKYDVLIPSKEEQIEIISTINRLLEQEEKAKALCNIIETVETMKKAILARAFRGELGSNDPAEASAIELLKAAYL
ncbi:restriction endonuclease subunit S [Paenibacillus sp. F411]|nr:restriction endonuclease subunit S [Paenibacillus sp. F411]